MVFSPSELILIRHGVTQTPDRLCGRTDVGLAADQKGVPALKSVLSPIGHILTSPAKRCVETADLIWGQGARPVDTRLWEQDFGAWENRPYTEIPDIGTLDQAALARLIPPEGESFEDLCARVRPALREIAANTDQGPKAIVVHAGVVRAALGLALGTPAAGLSFEVATLSLTRLRCLPDGKFSIIAVNGSPT